MFLGAVWLLAVAAAAREVSGYAADLCGANVGIINGHKIPIEDAPYIAALTYDVLRTYRDFICASIIIHERFLLTAAQCARYNCRVHASMGSERFLNTSTNTVIEIDKFLPHEHYDVETNKNDICLVKLKKPVPFSKKIAKIGVVEVNLDLQPGTMVKISGWGKTQIEKKELSLDLMQTTVPILSHKCCHETDKTVDDNEICAGVKGSGPCFGDGGGPLVYNNTLVGILSRAANNADSCGGGMDVYTSFDAYLEWITVTISNNL